MRETPSGVFMRKLLTTTLILTTAAMALADPEVRRAVPVSRRAEMPSEPQVRRAIPVKSDAIAREMRRASAFNNEDDAPVRISSATPAATPSYQPAKVKEDKASTSKSSGSAGTTFLLIIITAYFFPAINAKLCRHYNAGAIFVLNLFLGWTLFGWVAALVWSATKSPKLIAAK